MGPVSAGGGRLGMYVAVALHQEVDQEFAKLPDERELADPLSIILFDVFECTLITSSECKLYNKGPRSKSYIL